jgi:hypothetical protein
MATENNCSKTQTLQFISEVRLKTDPTLQAVLEQPNKKNIKHDLLAVGK